MSKPLFSFQVQDDQLAIKVRGLVAIRRVLRQILLWAGSAIVVLVTAAGALLSGRL